MVASRKVPVAVAPGRAATRRAKAAALNTSIPTGAEDLRTRAGKQPKSKKKKQRNTNPLVELLSKALILFFIIYTFSVCPADEDGSKPVCRALSEYRRLVLEPYLLPPVRSFIQSSYVAPQLAKIEPIYHRVLDTAQPVALRTQSEWNSRVVPQWNAYVVPQWKARVVPQWNARVVPQWNALVVPQLNRAELFVHPYWARAEREYKLRFRPHIRTAIRNLQRWGSEAEPYVILAATKTQEGYQAAKPYAIPVWLRVKAFIKDVLLQLQAARQQFVDPHVARIWENILEKSTGVVMTPTKSVPEFEAEVIPGYDVVSSVEPSVEMPEPTAETDVAAASIIAESVLGTTVETFTEMAPEVTASTIEQVPIPTEEPVPVPSITEEQVSTPSAPVEVVSDEVEGVSGTWHEIGTEPVVEVESVLSAASSVVVTEVPSAAAEVTEAASEAYTTASEPVSETIVSALSAIVPEPTTSESSTAPLDEEDEDDWLKELENDAPEASTPVEHTQHTQTPEEIAEAKRILKEETAVKRKKILARHDIWEDKIDDSAYEQEIALRTKLAEIRQAAVVELKESPEIRKQIDGLVADSEKFLRGADVYLKNLSKEKRKNEEKVTLWERVVGKVENKFLESLTKAQSYMNEWFRAIVQNEVAEVKAAGNVVRGVADQAQADLGLDYAWLDDVTYEDWQRYHDLVRSSENFTSDAHSIQNGTHVSAAANPIVAAVKDLQSEIEDVVVGFETRLRRTKRTGERSFGALAQEKEATASEPEVSILPIDVPGAEDAMAGDNVVIGKSKEEVVEALGKVPLEKTTEAEPTPAAQQVLHEEL